MAEVVLACADLRFSYHSAGPEILHGVSLTLRRGESLGVVGESGCGKTTVGRLLAGLLDPTEGEVTFDGRPWREARKDRRARRSVQTVFQDPYAALNPMMSVGDVVTESARIAGGRSRGSAKQVAQALLERVGIGAALAGRRPRRLSGGQCQRVVIARALAAGPTVLIADEPTSSLDVSVQAQILNMLSELVQEHDLTLVLVSHDLGVVGNMTDEVIVMYNGHVVERGPTAAVFRAPRHPYSQLLLSSVPGSEAQSAVAQNTVSPTAACPFAARCPRHTSECTDTTPPVGREGSRAWWCHHPLHEGPADRAPGLAAVAQGQSRRHA